MKSDAETRDQVTRGIVPGAPLQINNRVLVRRLSDEMGDASRIGKIGRVVRLDFDECGASRPADPMILLRFRDGTEDHFWKEEIE